MPKRSTTPSILPGCCVAKRGLDGWRGHVLTVSESSAQVHWAGDEKPDLCEIAILEVVEHPPYWERFVERVAQVPAQPKRGRKKGEVAEKALF